MDESRAAVARRRNELLRELGEIEALLALYDRVTSRLRHQEGVDADRLETETRLAGDRSGETPAGSPLPPPQNISSLGRAVQGSLPPIEDAPEPRMLKPRELVDAVRRILAESGQPMSRRELLAALTMRGLEVAGANPVSALGSTLWRYNDLVVHLPSHGYWPAEQPYPPAGYVPATTITKPGRRAPPLSRHE